MKLSVAALFIILFLFSFSCFSQTRIKMRYEGGIYTVPCKVNGLNLRFIFDTGASNVSISISEAVFMLKNGYLDSNDIIGSGRSMIANGSIVENTRIIIREIEIGGLILKNVEATVVHSMEAPLLLGQSVIQRLGRVEINRDELIIQTGYSHYSGGLNLSKLNIRDEKKVGSNWFELYDLDECILEIDLNSINKSSNLVSYWSKNTYYFSEAQKEIKRYLDIEKEYTYPNGIPQDIVNKWKKFSHILTYTTVDCTKKLMKIDEIIYYNKDGEIIKSISFSDNEWNRIVPDSKGEDEYNFICSWADL